MSTQLKFSTHPHLDAVEERRKRVSNGLPVDRSYIQHAPSEVNRELAPVQGLNPPGGPLLLDPCYDNDIVSLSAAGAYHPIFDVLGWEFSNAEEIKQAFLTYVGPDGTAAGTPSSGILTGDACNPNFGSYEVGGTDLVIRGWNRVGRKGYKRDLTSIGMKLCENQPQVRIDGTPITDDFEWDLLNSGRVIIQDMHRYLIIGDGALANQADGLQKSVTYGYVDSWGQQSTSLDSIVVNWNKQPLNGATGVTANGLALTGEVDFISMLESFVSQTIQRINNTPTLAGGTPLMVALTTRAMIQCLIRAWVCRTVCGTTDMTVFMENDQARAEEARLMASMTNDQSITLPILGVPIRIYAYDFELLDPQETEDGPRFLNQFYLLTPRVGNNRLLTLQLKDMRRVVQAQRGPQSLAYSDGGRFLLNNIVDGYCQILETSLQFRPVNRAPWAMFRAYDIDCTPALGHISNDPLSSVFIEQNKHQGWAVPYMPTDFQQSA